MKPNTDVSKLERVHKTMCNGSIEWAGNHVAPINGNNTGETRECKECGSGYWVEKFEVDDVKGWSKKPKWRITNIYGPIKPDWYGANNQESLN